MGRPKKRPGFDPEKVMKELIDAVTEIYEETGELKRTAEEIGLSALKVRKILITAGAYENDMVDVVNELRDDGKSVGEICEITGIKKSSVNGYLPYSKVPYNTKEVSLNADRIRVYRKRKAVVEVLQKDLSEDALWECVVAFQGYPFVIVGKGLPFSYVLKVGRDGTYNKELVVSRRKESKTLAWSSVKLAFDRAVERQGEIIGRAKALGDIRGISYVYAMFLRWGIVSDGRGG